MYTITICTGKGGVGKSTTAVNLAGGFQERGCRVLLCDVDRQNDAAALFLERETTGEQTMFDVLDGQYVQPENLILPSFIDGIDVAPGGLQLRNLEYSSIGYKQDSRARAIRRLLDSLTGYDIVVIDCPQVGGLHTFAAMCAANLVLVPTIPSTPSIYSLFDVGDEIAAVKQWNADVEVRHLLTMANSEKRRTRAESDFVEALRRDFGEDAMMRTIIPKAQAFESAFAEHFPVTHYGRGKRGQAAKKVRELVQELTEEHAHVETAAEAA